MYEAITNSIKVTVEPTFVEEQSSPDEDIFFWTYKVDIENLGGQSVQLRHRHWQITDALGGTEKVQGAGVVGQEPIIEPGESFTYVSGAPLTTASGIMLGSYTMQASDGSTFSVEIPAFSLDSPYTERIMN